MNGLRAIFAGILFVTPALLLAAGGFIQLSNGLAVNSAFPVPLSLSTDRPMPRLAYHDAAEGLARANTQDGESRISLSEARYRAGDASPAVLMVTQNGLLHAPASAEGWAFLAELLTRSDPSRAAKALGQAFTLAPFDYFWAGRRAQVASHLWDNLDSETKSSVLNEVRILWSDPSLRDGLLPLLDNPDGSKLVTQAHAGDPDTLRALNRFVSARRRQLQKSQ